MDLMDKLKTPAKERRRKAQQKAKMRAEKIEAQYDDIREIKEKMRDLTKEYYHSRTPWCDEERTMTEEKFKEKKQKLREQLHDLLNKHDIPKDYDKPDYKCEICDDTGRVNGQLCECEKKRIRHLKAYKIFKDSGISKARRKETFDKFSFKYYSDDEMVENTERTQKEQAQLILNKAQKFCEDVQGGNYQDVESLYIWGDVGRGKSFITFCVANQLINKGVPVLYRRYDRLISEIQRTYSKNDVATIDVLEKIFDIDVLILDDLGVEVPSRDSAVKLYQILEERATAHSPTIITSNYSIGQIGGRYNEDITGKRIVRRIAELCNIYKLESKGDITLIKKGGN